MADALSLNPTVLICLKKNVSTSNKGTPSKPGKCQHLLLRKKNATGVLVSMMRSSLVISELIGS